MYYPIPTSTRNGGSGKVLKMSCKIWAVAGSQSFVNENEAVNRILQVVCRDEIAMGITYKQAKEVDAHKDGATKRRRKEVSHAYTKA